MVDTEQLIIEALQGNSEAFILLIQKDMEKMYKAGWSILGNDEDVADAIQETILSAFERLSQIRGKESNIFTAWLMRIMVNKCYDIQRSKKGLIFMEIVPDAPIVETEYENVEWKEALSNLEEKYRLILLLYYVEGFKTRDIGQILEISEATVRTRLARGRKKLFVLYHEESKETTKRRLI